ncbi:MAG: CoB--CoM heterodisulfide reductase iron-sulfur subunit A family protein [Candidatus Thorarchaeota archaeon]
MTEGSVEIKAADTSAEPRIGVFVCHCGHNIAGVVDVAEVAEAAAKLPNVVFTTHEMFTCSDAGQETIRTKIAEHNLNRVVVASCSPRMHEPTFRRVVEEAGLNRYLFDQVNLREHVSWCHMRQPEEATEKAKDLVRMSVARAANLESLPIKTVQITPRVLIVGGGIAGLRAALDVADRGFEVVLVERDSELGGNVRKWSHMFPGDKPGSEVLKPLIDRVKKHKKIEVKTGARIENFEGYVGNFEAEIAVEGQKAPKKYQIGTVIVATGFQPYIPTGLYGYGKTPDIMTLAELQSKPDAEQYIRPSDGKPVKKIAYIGCVGSREAGQKGHEHCSRYCCSALAKTAGIMADKLDESLILYQDIRTYGKDHEDFQRIARKKHVIYTKFPAGEKPEVDVKRGKITVTWRDVLGDTDLEFSPDILVLASAMVPPEGIEDVGHTFSLTRSGDGFFNPEHVKLNPVTTHTAGIMIAGAAQAAKNASEAVIDASGAAAKAVGLMAKGAVEIESTVSRVIPELCSSCATCLTACPYGAITWDDSHDPHIAYVTEAKCHGCGTCAAACPSSAIVMLHSTNEQILAMVEAFLCPTLEPSVGGGA